MVPGFFFPGEDTGKRFVRLPAKQMRPRSSFPRVGLGEKTVPAPFPQISSIIRSSGTSYSTSAWFRLRVSRDSRLPLLLSTHSRAMTLFRYTRSPSRTKVSSSLLMCHDNASSASARSSPHRCVSVVQTRSWNVVPSGSESGNPDSCRKWTCRSRKGSAFRSRGTDQPHHDGGTPRYAKGNGAPASAAGW